jgi:hypothetical protein
VFFYHFHFKPLLAKIRQFPSTIALSSNININSNISNNEQNNIDFKASMPSSGIQQVIIKVSLLTAYYFSSHLFVPKK